MWVFFFSRFQQGSVSMQLAWWSAKSGVPPIVMMLLGADGYLCLSPFTPVITRLHTSLPLALSLCGSWCLRIIEPRGKKLWTQGDENNLACLLASGQGAPILTTHSYTHTFLNNTMFPFPSSYRVLSALLAFYFRFPFGSERLSRPTEMHK